MTKTDKEVRKILLNSRFSTKMFLIQNIFSKKPQTSALKTLTNRLKLLKTLLVLRYQIYLLGIILLRSSLTVLI
jgi:hypothetical protein